jgi:hypothetical protein
MRDIGALDKRVGNLEYYTSLSLLEQSALNKQDLTILDSTNLPRFKNGIVVDSFKGHSVADVGSSEYKAAIDPINQELRASFNISSHLLTFDSANSTNYMLTGPLLTANATHTLFVDQNKASKWFNINPFNVTNFFLSRYIYSCRYWRIILCLSSSFKFYTWRAPRHYSAITL